MKLNRNTASFRARLAQSLEEVKPLGSKRAREDVWQAFLAGGSTHSAMGLTLADLIDRAEREGVPYVLKASPGFGYRLEPWTDEQARHPATTVAE